MKNIIIIKLLPLVLLLLPTISLSQNETLGPIILPGTNQHLIHSESIDQQFRIYVSLPESYESSTESYPIVFMLDGDSMYTYTYGNARTAQYLGSIPELILVGIGYESANPRGYLGLRYRDYTPTIDEEQMQIYKSRSGDVKMPDHLSTGGAEDFYQFIESELKPYIYSTYRADTSDETLMGYSLGGLFTSFVLFNHTNAYERYVAGSPSLWFDSNITFSYEEEYARNHSDMDVSAFMSVGSLETPDIMYQNIQNMAEKLNSRSYPNLNFEFTILEGETHISGMSTSLNRGLLSVFAD